MPISTKLKKQFPSYGSITNTKNVGTPTEEVISISELKAKVTLQALVNHTVERVVQMNGDKLIAKYEDQRPSSIDVV